MLLPRMPHTEGSHKKCCASAERARYERAGEWRQRDVACRRDSSARERDIMRRHDIGRERADEGERRRRPVMKGAGAASARGFARSDVSICAADATSVFDDVCRVRYR